MMQARINAIKRVSGIIRHISVDTNGLPHAIYVTTANIIDPTGALGMFSTYKGNLMSVINLLADGRYAGKPFATGIKNSLNKTIEVSKRNELCTSTVIPK